MNSETKDKILKSIQENDIDALRDLIKMEDKISTEHIEYFLSISESKKTINILKEWKSSITADEKIEIVPTKNEEEITEPINSKNLNEITSENTQNPKKCDEDVDLSNANIDSKNKTAGSEIGSLSQPKNPLSRKENINPSNLNDNKSDQTSDNKRKIDSNILSTESSKRSKSGDCVAESLVPSELTNKDLSPPNKNENTSNIKLSSSDVLKKYLQKYSSHSKILSLFYDVFVKNIKYCDFDKAAIISCCIIDELIKVKKINDKKFIATKKLNLNNPKNLDLCEKIYSGNVSVNKFIMMSVDEMKSDEMKKRDERSIKDSICDVQVAKPVADSSMFKCGKCKQNKTTFTQLQTRGADEPMTTFVTCCTCGNRWKF